MNAPAVELHAMVNTSRPEIAHVFAAPTDATSHIFGGNFIASDSRFGQDVSKLAGHPHYTAVIIASVTTEEHKRVGGIFTHFEELYGRVVGLGPARPWDGAVQSKKHRGA